MNEAAAENLGEAPAVRLTPWKLTALNMTGVPYDQ